MAKKKPTPPYLTQPGSMNLGVLDSYLAEPVNPTSEPKDAERTLGGTIMDAGITGLRGVISVPEAGVGLANLVTFGDAGRLADQLGVDFKRAKEILSENYSDAQKQANRNFYEADGFGGKAAAAIANPSVILHAGLESVPQMLAGGAIARGLTMAAPALNPAIAAGIGEGIVGTGSAAETIRQQTEDGALTAGQVGSALASGAGTALFGVLGGQVARKLGIGDVDTMVAAGRIDPGVRKGMARAFLEGAMAEGLLEELPQSLQEQAWQNFALDRPLTDGMDEAAVLGMFTGGLMGGGAAVVGNAGASKPAADPLAAPVNPGDSVRAMKTGGAGAISRAVDTGMEAEAQKLDAAPIAPSLDPMAVDTIGRMHDQAAEDLQGLRDFSRPKVAQPAATAGMIDVMDPVEPQSRPVPLSFGPEAFTPAGIRESLDEVNERNKAVRDLYAPMMGDILNPKGEPFKNETAANRAKAKSGGEVVKVTGGWVVRPAAQDTEIINGDTGTTARASAGDGGAGVSVVPGSAQGAGSGVDGDGRRGNDASGSIVPPAPVRPGDNSQRSLAAQPGAIGDGGEVALSVTFGGKTYPVASIEDAQRKWIKFQETSGAGVSEVGNGVDIKDAEGKTVARVSFNGRAFDVNDNVIAEAPANALPEPDKAVALPAPRQPAFLKTKTVPEMTDEELKEAQAFYGPNHKRAKTIEKEMGKRAPQRPSKEANDGDLPLTDIRLGDKVSVDGESYTVTGPIKDGRKTVGIVADRDYDTNPLKGVKRVMLRGDDAVRAKIEAENRPAVAEPALGSRLQRLKTELANGGKVVDGILRQSNGMEIMKLDDAELTKVPADKKDTSEAIKARRDALLAKDEGKARKDEQEPVGASQAGEVVGEATEVAAPKALPKPKKAEMRPYRRAEGSIGYEAVPIVESADQGQQDAPQTQSTPTQAQPSQKGSDPAGTGTPGDGAKERVPGAGAAEVQAKRESEVGDSTFMTGFTGDGRQDNTGDLFSQAEPQVKATEPGVPDSRDATGKQASWVIREKATGAVVMETFDRKKVDALNTDKYEAIPIAEHLASLNGGANVSAKVSQQAEPEESPPLTEAEARKRLQWRDMGQRDNTKRLQLQFTDTTGGPMTYGALTKDTGAKAWTVEDSDGWRHTLLAAAKKKAEDMAIERLRRDGYVTKEQDQQAATGEKVNAKNGEGLGPADAVSPLEAFKATMQAIHDGGATVEDYRAAYERVRDEAAVKAELSKMKKDDLQITFRLMRNDRKDEMVSLAYDSMLRNFALEKEYGPKSFVLGGGSAYMQAKADALDSLVAGQTQQDLDAYAKEIEGRRAENKAKHEARKAALANPQTLSDFRNVINEKIRDGMTRAEAFLALTPEQRIKYDELEADGTKESREAAKRAAKTAVRSAGQTTAGEIVATKHTRDGHDLWVVKLADRLSADDYRTALASAKRLGGSYSSFRGNGAIPGFQFRTPEAAQAFLKLAGGDTTEAQGLAEQRRDAFDDDRSQSAVERLNEMADKLDDRAQESIDRDRKTNTARRARFAAAADREAEETKALAKTMRNIAEAIKEGRAKFLDAVRTKTQVELLRNRVAAAKSDELRAKYPSYADQEKRRGEPATAETADFAEFPAFTAFRSDLASLARQMLEVDGTKKLGQRLMSVADDVTDTYIEFAKKPENLYKLSTFSIRQGDDVKTAIFPSKDTAERAIRRSGLADRAIVLSEKRGVNRIIMSPSEAMSRGVWTGDGDKRITLTREFGSEMVQAIGRRGSKTNRLTVPWQFQTAHDRLNALKRIGIETPSEYRSALREFIGLQERAIVNKVREMELSMAGRKNDGLDFFPTPAEVADQMVAAADISPDMAVLEPSAGMGHIADRIRDAGAEPDVIELADDRRELLREKGYNLADVSDFLDLKPREFYTWGDVFRAPDGTEGVMMGGGGMGSNRVMLRPIGDDGAIDMRRGSWHDRDELVGIGHRGTGSGYDRIIMNPPFSNGRDIEHVMHAYDLLKPGGRIVAIMGESAFFNQAKKAEAFRQWLDDKGGTSEKLPAGSFMDPSLPVSTGVSARMVVIDKASAPAKDAEGEAMSRSEVVMKRGPGITIKDAASIARQLEDSGLVKVNVVESIDQMPADKRARVLSRVPAGDIRGVYFRDADEVWVVTKHLNSPDEFTFVALHEAFHRGLAKTIPGAKPLLRQMWETNQNLRKATKAQMDMHGIGRDEAIEEALADMAGLGQARDLKGWDKFVALVKGWLSDIMAKVGVQVEWTDDMVADFVAGITREGLRKGGVQVATDVPAMSWGDAVSREALPPTIDIDGKQRPTTNSKGQSIHPTEAGVRNFWRWFGDSKVVDAEGRPLVMYHGTSASEGGDAFTSFDTYASNYGLMGQGGYFTADPAVASSYTSKGKVQAPTVYPVYLSIGSPLDMDGPADAAAWQEQFPDADTFHEGGDTNESWYRGAEEALRDAMVPMWEGAEQMQDGLRAMGFDGITHMGGGRYGKKDGPSHRVYIAFDPTQIKSATGNDGTFDPENPSIMFSRAGIAQAARQSALDFFGSAGAQVGWLDKTIKTQYAKAQKFPAFGRVFNKVQDYIEGISTFANQAADKAPDILPKLESWKDLKRGGWDSLLRHGLSKADSDALASPVFEGTLNWTRDKAGKLTPIEEMEARAADMTAEEKARELLQARLLDPKVLRMWQGLPLDQFEAMVNGKYEREMLQAGVVFTDAELKALYNLSPEQIGHYRQFRAAVDESLDHVAATEAIRLLGKMAGPELKAMASTPEGRAGLRDAVEDLLAQDPDNSKLWNDIADKFNRAQSLKDRGYAPLTRFGKYFVHVVDKDTKQTLYFGLEETAKGSNRLARTLSEEYPDASVEQGVMSQESYKLMNQVPVSAMEMFAEAIGADRSEVFQKYIQLSKNNRSTLKRLIRRKGTAGFSMDAPRVLASFVTSNARAVSSSLHVGDAKELAKEIRQGDVQDEAVKLVDSVTEPEDTASWIRGSMFVNFIGGSIASAVVNLTQPVMMTLPYLSQWGGITKAGKRLVSAAKMAAGGRVSDPSMRQAIKMAEDNGTIEPQEIHHLLTQATSGLSNMRGVGPALQKMAFLWGTPFSLAEQFNRRSSFIAAYQTAMEEGIENPQAFAEKAVVETQGLYNTGNRMNWSRNPVGAVALTFKQFSVHYLEWLGRMAKSGPEGKRAVAWAIALMVLTAGADGLPFMSDLDDLLDTIGQALGYDMNAKRSRREMADAVLGDELGAVLTRGFSATAGFPVDVSMRMGMGNMIPATDIMLKSNTDTARSLAEVAGAGGGIFDQYREAVRMLLAGDPVDAMVKASPVAIQNLVKAGQMAATGEYRDTKDRKVMDVNAADAGMKALGFQPAKVARESAMMSQDRRSEQLAKVVESEIVETWARAVADGEADRVQDARKRLAAWNENNPDMPIKIKPSQIRSRVKALKQGRADRYLKTVAPERREAAKQAMEGR